MTRLLTHCCRFIGLMVDAKSKPKSNAVFKDLLAFLIRCTGIPFFIRNIHARNKVTILVYHNPKAEVLARHLAYLSRHFSFIPLDLLVKAIRSQDWSPIPPKAIVITIDDGHKGNYDTLELFRRYQVIPTIYICTKIVNTNRHFWWHVLGANTQPLEKRSNSDRLQYLEREFGFTPTKEYLDAERQALSYEEIIMMKNFVDFQSHSRFHPLLTTCSDEECKEEIVESRNDIEVLLYKKCKHFCFPNGDYTERELAFVKMAGYLSARTIDLGWNDLSTDPYKLKALGVTNNASVNLLVIQVCGIPSYVRFVLKGSLKGKKVTTLLNRSKS